ncbi:hypothetical protein Dda_1435 [Drechslerella dactyloides]|uniref:ER membrane protein complex subunit 10 n=1 Tax=Drechslerella dactyloides TaxID=74499 RepID=A0AAD6J1S1_DREDA|nr:hypothetical protein Dda_1435 [Drechslerella dactyloides]
MRLLSTLFLLASLPLGPLAAGDGKAPENFPLPADFDEVNRAPPQTLLLNRWAVSAGDNTAERYPLGMIRYVASSLSASFNPMTDGLKLDPNEAFRVGILKRGKWIGSVRSGKMLQPNMASTITLHVDEKGEIFHVELDAVEIPQGAEKPETEIVILRPFAGVQPTLNKPVVLMPDGRMAPPKEEEKTFLQKYWWVLVAGAILLVAAPGEAPAK